MSVEKKYAPTTLDDVVFCDAATEMRVKAYASGGMSGHVILYGPNGTGKTTVANLLPICISGSQAMIESKNMAALLSMADLKDYLKKSATVAQKFYESKYYLVYDEADAYRGNMAKFWTAVDSCGDDLMMIFTTNNPLAIPASIRSRADEIGFPALAPQQFLDRAQRILIAEGVDLPSRDVLFYLSQTNGVNDLRKFCRKLDELIFLKRNSQPLPPVPAPAANQRSLKIVV
jgi:replication-associated recombination protein RarA